MNLAPPRLSIIIISWNTCELLAGCLESIYRYPAGEAFDVWVVDNASSDASTDMLQKKYPQVRLITNPVNLGFAAANNQAARLTQGCYFLLLNPDTVLHVGCLATLCTHLDDHPQTGIAGPRILNPDGTLQVSAQPEPSLLREIWRLFHLDRLASVSQYKPSFFDDQKPKAVDVLKGACLLLRRELTIENGLFDEQFFMYSEEVDLCTRVRKAGWRIDWVPAATITHYGGQSTRQNADDMFLELYRNKVKYFRKHTGAFRTSSYKALLYVASILRWLPSRLMANTKIGRRRDWSTISRQYGKLMQELPRF